MLQQLLRACVRGARACLVVAVTVATVLWVMAAAAVVAAKTGVGWRGEEESTEMGEGWGEERKATEEGWEEEGQARLMPALEAPLGMRSRREFARLCHVPRLAPLAPGAASRILGPPQRSEVEAISTAPSCPLLEVRMGADELSV